MHESATVWEKKNDEEWVDLFRRIAVELKAFFNIEEVIFIILFL